MTQRMPMHEVVPDGYRAVLGLERYSAAQLEPQLYELVKLRASMTNGCAFCVAMHSHDAVAAGEDPQRLFQLAAWREAECFTAAERAALALTDQVTRIADGGVSDAVWDEARRHFSEREVADLILAIATINVWNRIAVSTRATPPTYDAD